MAVILLIAYLFSTPTTEDSLNDDPVFPLLDVSKHAVSTAEIRVSRLTVIILLPVTFSKIHINAAISRQAWAFARDKGLPLACALLVALPNRGLGERCESYLERGHVHGGLDHQSCDVIVNGQNM